MFVEIKDAEGRCVCVNSDKVNLVGPAGDEENVWVLHLDDGDVRVPASEADRFVCECRGRDNGGDDGWMRAMTMAMMPYVLGKR